MPQTTAEPTLCWRLGHRPLPPNPPPVLTDWLPLFFPVPTYRRLGHQQILGMLTQITKASVGDPLIPPPNSPHPWPKLKWCESCSVMSDPLWPHGLYSPWNSPGQLFLTQELNQVSCTADRFFTSWAIRAPSAQVQFSSVAQSCLTLWDPMDCSTPGFPVHHQLPELTQTHVYQVGAQNWYRSKVSFQSKLKELWDLRFVSWISYSKSECCHGGCFFQLSYILTTVQDILPA